MRVAMVTGPDRVWVLRERGVVGEKSVRRVEMVIGPDRVWEVLRGRGGDQRLLIGYPASRASCAPSSSTHGSSPADLPIHSISRSLGSWP